MENSRNFLRHAGDRFPKQIQKNYRHNKCCERIEFICVSLARTTRFMELIITNAAIYSNDSKQMSQLSLKTTSNHAGTLIEAWCCFRISKPNL